MKTLGLFLSLLTLALCHRNLVIEAINNLLNDFFAKGSLKIDLIYYVDVSKKSEIDFDDLLRNKNDSISFQISAVDHGNSWKNKLNISSLLIFDSAKTFQETRDNITWLSNKRIRYQHLVYVPDLTISDLEVIEDGFSIDNVNFLMNETDKSIDLVSGFMFTKEKCHQNQFVTINRFNGETERWENSNFYPNKYQNFHECNLSFGLQTFRQISLKHVSEETFIELAEHFNFKLDYKYLELPIFVEGIKSNAFDLFDTEEGFHGDLLWITSAPFAFERISFCIPPGEPYTAFEKMILPFDSDVWIGIFATFLIGLTTIQVISFTSVKVQNFVFGRNIRTPTLNLVNIFIFLNGAQPLSPKRNFARFLLTLFIIWSLIIRTCYQSQYFRFLQADARKPKIKTSDELLDRNFTLYFLADLNKLNKSYDSNGVKWSQAYKK